MRGVERAQEASNEVSVRQAATIVGASKDAILAAVNDGRLSARWDKRASNNGRPGPREQWIIERESLDRFVADLEPCHFPGCQRLGITPESYCGREHAMSVTMSSEAQRVRMHELATQWWKEGHAPQVRGLYESWGGLARQRWGGRWAAKKPPGLGALPRGRQPITLDETVVEEIRTLSAQGWGRRAISNRLLVSERAVRNILAN